MSAVTQISWAGERANGNRAGVPFEIFGGAPVGMALCTPEGLVIETNPVFQSMFGSGLGDLEQLWLGDLVAEENRDEIDCWLQELMSGQRLSFRFQSKIRDDSQKATQCIVWHVEGRNGSFDRALIMAQDPGGKEYSADRWHQIQRLETVGQMAGGIAHDFNNLLTGVMLYCDLLLAGLQSGSLRKYAEEIRSAVMQSADMVRQLLEIGRPHTVERRTLSLNEIIEDMNTLLMRMAGEKIRLECHLDPELGLTRIDPAQARQVLLNLVLNSRDALPHGGRITIETSNCTFQRVAQSSDSSGDQAWFPCVLLAVSDNGCGMNEETRHRLFEPFFTTKDPGKGSGLGLTTVHNIVAGGGGLIHVESELGKGTRMVMVLPRIFETLESEARDKQNCSKVLHTLFQEERIS